MTSGQRAVERHRWKENIGDRKQEACGKTKSQGRKNNNKFVKNYENKHIYIIDKLEILEDMEVFYSEMNIRGLKRAF